MVKSKLKNLEYSNDKVFYSIDDIQDEEDIYNDEIEISIFEFRKCCGELYYNIFLIFAVNFDEEGQKYFFEWLSKFFETLNIQNDSILMNKNDLLLVEAIIHLVKSIIEAHCGLPSNNLLNFIKFMINSKVLHSEKILESFLLLIHKAITYIGVEIETFQAVVNLMNQIIDVKTLEPVGCFILMSLADCLQVPCQNFDVCLNIFNNKYQTVSAASLINLTEALCSMVGKKDNDDNILVNSQNQVSEFYKLLLSTVISKIKDAYSLMFINNCQVDLDQIKLEFLKNFGVANIVLKKSYLLNCNILEVVFDSFLAEVLSVLEYFYTKSFFCSDANFIKDISVFLVFSLTHLQDKTLKYFDKINEMMLTCYKENNNNIICIRILSILYCDVGSASNEKKLYISKNFCVLSNSIYENILKGNVLNVMDLIIIFANFWAKAIEKLININFDIETIHKTIGMFADAIPSFVEKNLHKAIIKVLIYFISFNSLFPAEVVTPVFDKIVLAVFNNLEHFGDETLVEFTNFTYAGLAFSTDLFLNNLSQALRLGTQKVTLEQLKENHILIILNYLKNNSRNDKSIKLILNDLVGIANGKQQVDCFMGYEMKLKIQGLGLNY